MLAVLAGERSAESFADDLGEVIGSRRWPTWSATRIARNATPMPWPLRSTALASSSVRWQLPTRRELP